MLETMKDPSHGCPSVCLNRDSSRFILLGFLIALYMLAGAAIFSALERPGELFAQQCWEGRLEGFGQGHGISLEDLKALLEDYEEANAAGIRMDTRRDRWDFAGSFYFVGTVVSTIGFGMTAPSTTVGKVILVFYGLVGCSAAILFFNLFLERVITMLGLLMHWCHRRRTPHCRPHRGGWPTLEAAKKAEDGEAVGGATRDTSEGPHGDTWRPSVYHVTLILFATTLVVACGAATLYSTMEGWSYFESLYFCFVAFSTVGFGDLVSGQREHHEDSRGYQLANGLLMLLGVCCTYSLFNTVSVIIKEGLNWTLGQLLLLQGCVCPGRPQKDFSGLLVLLCPGGPCPSVHHTQPHPNPRHPQTTDPCWGQRTAGSLPHPTSKCLCANAVVETVCRGSVGKALEATQTHTS
ncbi:potassium channel subfamily K member 13 [Osmerus mordax]|uniref:potassium channel subfamily K member 13 n=1 Tax=Osmerus mordax TaxID=8014 RepID=UPI0035105E89